MRANEDEVVLRFPADCLAGVGEVWSGQYEFRARVCGAPVVLDVGANCGAFALWARQRWPGCAVECYEPHPVIFRSYLLPNTRHEERIRCHQAAVGDRFAGGRLRPGNNTRLCSSLYDIGRQGNESMAVRVVAPEDLPRADIVKIDTEGSEGFIVEHLAFVPALMVVEYHTEELRQRVEAAVRGRMELIGCEVLGPGWGHVKFCGRAEQEAGR